MDVFDLAAKITLDTSEYERGLMGLGTMAGGAARAVGLAFVAASTAVVGFGASSVKVGEEFDKAMAQVAATLGTTVDGMENEVGHASTTFGEFNGNLREFAQFMGANTAFSATQAAEALNYMALAGYDAQKSMDMLPNVLNLAAAGCMDLGTASDMVTDAQTALGLSMEQTTDLVDRMARTASRSNTSVSQMGNAILTIGGTAKFMNGTMFELANGEQIVTDSTTELSMVLGVLADNGIKGSEAGTHLRNALLKLSGDHQTKELMQEMGVAIFDAEGKMRSFADIFPELSAAMEDMTDEQKLQFFSDAFNVRDVASMNALLGTTRERWAELAVEITNAGGAAAEMAATQLDNLAGDVTIFKSALEGAQIAISDRLTPTLREFVQMGTEGVSNISTAFKDGGLESAMGAFGDWLAGAANMFLEALPTIVSAAGQLLSAFGKGIVDNADVILSAAEQIMQYFLNGIIANENAEGGGKVVEIIQKFVDMLIRNLPLITRAAQSLVRQLGQGLTNAVRLLAPIATNIIIEVAKFITDPQSVSAIIQASLDIAMTLAQGLIEAIPVIVSALPTIIQNIVTILTENVPLILDGVISIVNMIAEELPEIVTVLAEALPDIINMIIDAVIALLPLIIEGNIRVTMAIVEHLPEIIKALIDALPGVINAIITGLSRLGGALIAWISGVFGELGAAVSTWWAGKQTDIENGWNAFIEKAKVWFEQLPYNVGLILGEVIGALIQWHVDAFNWCKENIPIIVDKIIEFFKELPGKILIWLTDIIVTLAQWANDMITTVQTEIPRIIDEIAQWFEQLPDMALEWGKDMIDQFFDGIDKAWSKGKDVITGIGDGIKRQLGHSHPEEGPLADDYTWMPDMMDLFIQGIKDNTGRLQDQIADTFNLQDQIQNINAGSIEVANTNGNMTGRLITPTENRDITVILELDKVALAKTVFELNNNESQRMGVALANV